MEPVLTTLLPTPATDAARLGLHTANRLKLGLFGANCSSGRAATMVPERWSGDWDDNLRMAQMADEAGIDFILPIARWRGYGGATNFEGSTLETITWATALLASTRRLTVFGTVHAPLIHPILAAKQFVTADRVGHGRYGLNVVCGWNSDEFAMFGATQLDHDERYRYGAEWLDVVMRLWTEREPFDYDGAYFHLKEAQGDPKPWDGSRPVVMNAGGSPVGREFATSRCDLVFLPMIDFERAAKDAAAVAERARVLGRTVRVCANGYVVCRPTQREADEYLRWYAEENADWGAVDRLMALNGLQSQSYDPAHYAAFRNRWAAGHGGFPVVGDPDRCAQLLAGIADAGIFGFCFSFVNYAEEFPYFRDEVLPRLAALGYREAL